MRTRAAAAPMPLRVSGLLALFIVIAWLLAGCSSSADSEYSSGGEDMASYAAEPQSADGMDSEAMALDSDASQGDDRSEIVTGSMYMTVEDPIAAANQAVGIVQSFGGRIDARNETAPYEGNGGSAWLMLRIPADDLETVVDDLRELGTVDEFSTSTSDVTNQVTDLDAQISTLRASTARIEALLLEAKDIDDIIALENELDGRQAELESLEAQQRGLNDQVSMSTVELTLTTEPVVIVDDSPDNFWDGLVSGWNALLGFISWGLVAFGVLLPWLVLMGLVALLVVGLVRLFTARSRRARAESTGSAYPAAPPAPPAPPAMATAQDAPPSPGAQSPTDNDE